MGEEKDWVNEDIEGLDSELDYSTDPTRFNISLTDQDGQPGGAIRPREDLLRLNL